MPIHLIPNSLISTLRWKTHRNYIFKILRKKIIGDVEWYFFFQECRQNKGISGKWKLCLPPTKLHQ